jgi:bifunctional non-homologous end joining protein LigD
VSARPQAPGRRRLSSDAQPGLPIALPPLAPSGRLALEAATPCAAPFDGDEWLFSVDWEGSRCLLIAASDGTVRLQGETATLDERFPEVVAGAAFAVRRRAVVDGTICVLDAEGRPDLAALFRRVAAGAARPRAVYLATDLLHLDGEPLTGRPLLARLAALADLVPQGSRIQLPDHVTGHGRALATAAEERGLAAIVARRQDAPYRAGVASPDRLRVALSKRREAVVVGWHRRASRTRIVLGDWVEGRLGLVGTAAVDEPAARHWLAGTAEAARVVVVEDRDAAGAGVTWVRPRLVATVEPIGESAAGLPAWRLVALRDDVDPVWCVRRAPVNPPQASAHQPLRPFSPTVLSPLPLDGAA